MRLKLTSAFSKIILDEKKGLNEVPNQVQVLRVGSFNHPQYGKFDITKRVLSDMVSNFKARVRGVDVCFDYYHESGKDASAWVGGLELREGGTELWAIDVEWTPTAEKKLAEKELRYFSPDFAFAWKDPESGKTFSNVLFGGGLTNRPFVKEMQAIVAAEVDDTDLIQELLDDGYTQEEIDAVIAELDSSSEIKLGGPGSGPQGGGGGGRSTAASRQERLQKSRDKDVAYAKRSNAVKAGLQRARASKTQSDLIAQRSAQRVAEKKSKKLSEGKTMKTLEEALARIEELETENVTLSESNKETAIKLAAAGGDKVATLEKQIADLQAQLKAAKADGEKVLEEKKMAEKENAFNVLLSEGKACVAQKEAYLKDDMTSFIKLAEPVNLKGKGTVKDHGGASDDREDKVIQLAEEKRKADPKLSIGDSIKLANKEVK